MTAGELGWGQMPTDTALGLPVAASALPAQLRRCRRVVAITVHLPEFLLAASGLVSGWVPPGCAPICWWPRPNPTRTNPTRTNPTRTSRPRNGPTGRPGT